MFYRETEFQDSPLGKIPRNWDIVKLGESCTYNKGKKPDKIEEEYVEGYLPYLSTRYLREDWTAKFAKSSEKVITVSEGDLILLWDGSNAGEVFLAKRGILSSTMVKIALKEQRHNVKFLFYMLKMSEHYLKGQTKGTGVPHVDSNVLDRLVIPIPKLPEQENIVRVLGDVDSAIDLTDKVIAKTERLKKGLMQQLLTRGIGHTELEVTELGKTPKEWQVTKLGDVVIDGPQNGLYKQAKHYGDGIAIVRIDSFSSGSEIEPTTLKRIRLEKPELKCYSLNRGDIVLNRVNSIDHVGKSVVIRELSEPVVFESNMMRFNVDEKVVNPAFLVTYLNCPKALSYIRSNAKRAVHQASVNQEDVKSIPIPVPPIEEQQKINSILSAIEAKLKLELAERKKLERTKHGLMDLLLTGKVRIKVD